MQHQDFPLVSIVIPTHNRASLLPRAIRSALGQTYPAIEVVIVDDGSQDDTSGVVARFQQEYPNLRYFRHEKPQGACLTRNRGIEESSGTFIALLDDDDEFTFDRIEKLMAVITRKPGYSFVCSDYLNIMPNGTRRSRKPGTISLRKILWMNYASQSILVEKKKILATGGFDPELTAAQDYDAFTRLIANYGPAYRLGKVLYIYHQEHEAPRITATPLKKLRGYYDYYCKHKSQMSRAQRAYHLYRLLKLRGRRISLGCFLKMVPLRYYLLELNDLLIYHTSFYRYVHRLKRIFRP